MTDNANSSNSGLPQSPKFREARDALLPDIRGIYDELVRDYAWCTTKSYGQGYVAYSVLAEMVRIGWRPTSKHP